VIHDSLLHEILNAGGDACAASGFTVEQPGSDGKWRLSALKWHDDLVMKNPNSRLRRTRISYVCLIFTLMVTFVWPAALARATVPLTQSDVALAIYSSEGTSWRQLTPGALGGYFGAHRCNCTVTLSAQLQLTSSGQTNLGNSTVSVNFLLGANCLTAPASCVSLGQVTFSASQSATSPTFDSSLVFQAAAGSSAVNCGNLTAGSTTLWAVLAQDGVALTFAPRIDLPVITTTVAAPLAVTALAANQGLLVTWTPPADTSLVAGYQVLCLPRPTAASTAGYESCPFGNGSPGSTVLTPADATELCSAEVAATTTQVRLSGLVNGTPYTVAVIAIDPSGGVSTLSPPAMATPEPTKGFYEKYKEAGGSATGCALTPSPPSGHPRLLWIALATALLAARGWRRRGRRRPKLSGLATAAIMVLASSATARAQIVPERSTDEWARNPSAADIELPPDWGFELGLSLYRPAVDSEFGGPIHPYTDTFGSSRHLMSEVELDRYLGHPAVGSWGVGLRIGYQKVTGAAFLSDGLTASGDETSLRLVPLSLSAFYKADGLPGLRIVPLVPYVKAGLDGAIWTESTTGGQSSHNGFTPGWHVAAGMAIGLNSLGTGAIKQGAVAGLGSVFFEWDYAAISGLGMGSALHVGDSTWYAGLMFDL
jgi:hypothetical protein